MKIVKNLEIALAIVAVIWAVFVIDFVLPFDLRIYGIRPRNIGGLTGIVFAPFLHGDLRHITGNSGVLFVLLFVAMSLDRKLAAIATVIIVILGGGLVWLLGHTQTSGPL